jgi:hypothetical protein
LKLGNIPDNAMHGFGVFARGPFPWNISLFYGVQDQEFDPCATTIPSAYQKFEIIMRNGKGCRGQPSRGAVSLEFSWFLPGKSLVFFIGSDPVPALVPGWLAPVSGSGIIIQGRLMVKGIAGFLPAPETAGFKIQGKICRLTLGCGNS